MPRRPRELPIFVLLVIALPAILFVSSSHRIPWSIYPRLLLFILAIVGASFLGVRNPAGWVVRATGTILYAVVYLFNPITALFVAATGQMIGSTSTRGWVTWRACFNAAQVGLSAAIGSLVYRALGGDPANTGVLRQVVPILFGPIAYQVSNNFFVGMALSQVRGLPFFTNWLASFRSLLFSDLLGIPAAVLLVILYTHVHFLLGFGLLVVLPFEAWTLQLYLERRRVYTQIVESLVRAWEFSQPRVRGHSRRVADLSTKIARELGLVEREIESIEFASLLHDVGMIGLDEGIYASSPAPETAAWLETHVQVGAEIARELPRQEIAEMVLNHHRGFSGEGKQPSIGARIIAVAEEVDSRLHGLFQFQNPASLGDVIHEIEGGKSRRFDPRVVDGFLRVVRSEESQGEAVQQEGGFIPVRQP